MLKKLTDLFAKQPSLEKVTLIIRPTDGSLTLAVLPHVKEVKGSTHKPGEPKPEALKLDSFICKGSDEVMEEALSGGFIDLIASDAELSQELQSSETRKKKAIEAAKKEEEAAKKRAKESKGEDPKKLLAEIERLKEELAAEKADKQTSLL